MVAHKKYHNLKSTRPLLGMAVVAFLLTDGEVYGETSFEVRVQLPSNYSANVMFLSDDGQCSGNASFQQVVNHSSTTSVVPAIYTLSEDHTCSGPRCYAFIDCYDEYENYYPGGGSTKEMSCDPSHSWSVPFSCPVRPNIKASFEVQAHLPSNYSAGVQFYAVDNKGVYSPCHGDDAEQDIKYSSSVIYRLGKSSSCFGPAGCVAVMDCYDQNGNKYTSVNTKTLSCNQSWSAPLVCPVRPPQSCAKDGAGKICWEVYATVPTSSSNYQAGVQFAYNWGGGEVVCAGSTSGQGVKTNSLLVYTLGADLDDNYCYQPGSTSCGAMISCYDSNDPFATPYASFSAWGMPCDKSWSKPLALTCPPNTSSSLTKKGVAKKSLLRKKGSLHVPGPRVPMKTKKPIEEEKAVAPAIKKPVQPPPKPVVKALPKRVEAKPEKK